MTVIYGASSAEWRHFSTTLNLTVDLLPVVSNPNLKISPQSTMKALGKTPSLISGTGVVGIANWTQKKAASAEVSNWARNPDYGVCVQTRLVRAIDIDITDASLAERVKIFIVNMVGYLPLRYRADSSKCLLVFALPGEMGKRVIKTEHGIIEFLATGQQFIAAGTHPAGARYEWALGDDTGLPDEIPPLTLVKFEELWAALTITFATGPSTTSKPSERAAVLHAAQTDDDVAQAFYEHGRVLSVGRQGQLNVTCPWDAEHTGPTSETSTAYFPPHTGGYEKGNFKCLHAHCQQRTMADVRAILDIATDVASEFEDLTLASPIAVPASDDAEVVEKASRFRVKSLAEFCDAPPMVWQIRGVLPNAELAVLYGPSTSGKSFLALDMAFAIALGTDWRGNKTKQGNVIYICAEGAGGARTRFSAYCQYNGIDLQDRGDVPFGVIDVAPNFLEKAEALEVAKQILAAGGADLIIVDTMSQVILGGNENSGEDIGKMLANCKGLHRACHCPVMLVHHTGKDDSRGARGHSSLKAAADVEMEVCREGRDRRMTVTKLKDGADGGEYPFTLETIGLGDDADGNPVTSCVVTHG